MARQAPRKSRFWMTVVTVLATLVIAALAMNFAPAEKKLDRKVEHRYAISDAQFRREMGVLLGPAILPGNTVTDLENGDQIFPAMLEAIRSAQKTVTFETYIYWSGEIGRKFSEAFCERAKAGVAAAGILELIHGVVLEYQHPALFEAGDDLREEAFL